MESLGSALDAVGLGALVTSMIMELIMESSTQTNDSYSDSDVSLVKREEMMMSEYLRRHRRFMNNEQQSQEEMRRLKAHMSNHLTILTNCCCMMDRWILLRLQMLIHVVQYSDWYWSIRLCSYNPSCHQYLFTGPGSAAAEKQDSQHQYWLEHIYVHV